MNVAVLCTGNPARSILLEHILNETGPGRLHAFLVHPVGSGKTGALRTHLKRAGTLQ
jgi:protein-tyrosine-phosphatase